MIATGNSWTALIVSSPSYFHKDRNMNLKKGLQATLPRTPQVASKQHSSTK
jgi:hypothetical protein